MVTTEFRRTKDGTFVCATYGLEALGNQAPHFAITLDEYKHARVSERGWLAGGCQHEQVRIYFPELAPFIQWHLCSTEGPMHYIANAVFWHDCHHGTQKYAKPGDREHAHTYLANTVVLGALPTDASLDDLLKMSRYELEDYLKARLPALLDAFKADMRRMALVKLGGD
jgi:hypothetical protein